MERDTESPLAAIVAAAKAERDRATELLTGPCPACDGTTRWPTRRSSPETCRMCELEAVPGTMVAPRSWWLSTAGREP